MMEQIQQKHVLISALSVAGVGLGVGLGKWVCVRSDHEISEDQIVKELMKLVIDGKDNEVTFDEFPYYLSERIKIMLTSAGFVHLKKHDLSKHTRNLSPVSRAILLSGPAEFYHQKLARALAHYFGSKLLLLDVNYLSLKMQNKYRCPSKESYLKRFISKVTRERVSGLFGSLSILPSTGAIRGILQRQSSTTKNSNNPSKLAPLKCTNRFCFDEKRFLDSLYKVLVSISETGSAILYIKDAEKIFLRSPKMYSLFQKLLQKLSGHVLILGSQIYDSNDSCNIDEKLTTLFPCNIEIQPPQDETHLKIWKDQLEEAVKKTQLKNYTNLIAEVLAANDIDCDDMASISHNAMKLLSKHIKEIAASAIFYQLMDNKHPEYRNGKLIISAQSLCHVLTVFQEGESSKKTKKESKKDDAKKGSKKDSDTKAAAKGADDARKGSKKHSDIKAAAIGAKYPPDNGYEREMRQEIIPANEIGVSFSDIGAMDDVKESLQEAIMLPLRRPDLFKGDGILKPCKGVLLFGPPGTGKTMLAKAIANEAGASFINVSSSTITAAWYGQSERNVRALFTLAAKVSPTIIFIDEVDSLLGKRSGYESNVTRRVKNEFMSRWDGLLSKPDERIMVLGATNMPFDLDEAIIRRFQRRIMVGLPSAENRESILKTLLAKEKHEDLDFKELSTMTEGYSGSDLKNLCVTAAHGPVKELMQQEMKKEMKKKEKEAEVGISEDASNATEEDQVISLRPINMEDMKQAKIKVSASSSAEGSIMNRLQEWNELYGEGGSRKKEEQQLSYYI